METDESRQQRASNRQISGDRNKTELTHAATRRAAEWLDTHGFKPIELEVAVAKGWVADLAGVIDPTQTELIELKLIKQPPRSPDHLHANPDLWTTYQTKYGAWRETFERFRSPLTAVVEVKTQRSDFLSDHKFDRTRWQHRPADLCLLAVTPGVIRITECPVGWGLIDLSADGNTVKGYRIAPYQPVTIAETLGVVYEIALNRDHSTRHRRLRELQKSLRIHEAERRINSRMSACIAFVADCLEGKPLLDAWRYNIGYRCSPDTHIVKRIEDLKRHRCQQPASAETVVADT